MSNKKVTSTKKSKTNTTYEPKVYSNMFMKKREAEEQDVGLTYLEDEDFKISKVVMHNLTNYDLSNLAE